MITNMYSIHKKNIDIYVIAVIFSYYFISTINKCLKRNCFSNVNCGKKSNFKYRRIFKHQLWDK